MNTNEHLVTCLIEACAKVQQAACEALRFGLDDGYPDAHPTNAEDIAREFLELVVVMDMCRDYGLIPNVLNGSKLYDEKRGLVEKRMNYARDRGTLND